MFVSPGSRAGRTRTPLRLSSPLEISIPGTKSSGSGQFTVAMKTTGGDETASGFSIWSPSNPYGSFFTFAFCGDLMTGTRLGLPDLHDGVIMFTNGAAVNPAAYICLGTGGAAPLYFSTNNALRMTVDANGLIGIGSAAPSGAFLNVTAAGTTSNAPLKLTSGTNLTTAAAGAIEYDGVQLYNTIDTTSGRGAIPVEQYVHLAADGSTISTIANFFGANSNISLVANAYYEIEIVLYYLKTTAGTVTWTLTNSAAPTSQNIYYEMSPITGIVAPPGTATMLIGQVSKDATAAKTVVTGSLTSAVDHYAYFRIQLKNGTGTSLKIQATCSAGTITPRLGSQWKARRLSPNNIGTLAA